MINGIIRPWGNPKWLLNMPSISQSEWMLIGNISTQERCLATLMHQHHSYKLKYSAFFEIKDEWSRFSDLSEKKVASNRNKWIGLTNSSARDLFPLNLLEPIRPIKKRVRDWIETGHATNVILDVSCLPERVLFPTLRWLLESEEITNLMVSYMHPERYTHENLAFDAKEATHLSTFVNDSVNESSVKHVIVGVGFLAFGLPEWLKKTYSDSNAKVSLIFPFPSTPSSVQKAWEFVRRIEPNVSLKDYRQIARVAVNDISGCFDRISSITSRGSESTVFAPFGPKAHSVAMCMHAVKMDASAYFTQPSYYHPDYSTGYKVDNGLPAGCVYALKINGRNLYI